MLSKEIREAIDVIKKLPSIGERTASRIVLSLIKNKTKILAPMIDSLQFVSDHIVECKICYNVDVGDICSICKRDDRNKEVICVVEHVEDLWNIENTGTYKGTYHVIGGKLSAIEGMTPNDINLTSLIAKVKKRDDNESVKEVIIALNSTLDGETTALYITHMIHDICSDIVVSKLPTGIPLGGEIEYLDGGTIDIAFKERKKFE